MQPNEGRVTLTNTPEDVLQNLFLNLTPQIVLKCKSYFNVNKRCSLPEGPHCIGEWLVVFLTDALTAAFAESCRVRITAAGAELQEFQRGKQEQQAQQPSQGPIV